MILRTPPVDRTGCLKSHWSTTLPDSPRYSAPWRLAGRLSGQYRQIAEWWYLAGAAPGHWPGSSPAKGTLPVPVLA